MNMFNVTVNAQVKRKERDLCHWMCHNEPHHVSVNGHVPCNVCNKSNEEKVEEYLGGSLTNISVFHM